MSVENLRSVMHIDPKEGAKRSCLKRVGTALH